MLKEVIKAIRNDEGYDYIANNYTRFTKEELKDIILECLYVIDDNVLLSDYLLNNVANELEDRWEHLL